MKIAINCIFFQPRGGGIREYIYCLVNHLERIDFDNEYILYVLKDQVDYAKANLPIRFKIKELPYGSSTFDVFRRSFFSQKFWAKEESIEKIDIFHSPFFHAPRLKHAKVIMTVHDLRYYRYPSTYPFFRYIFLKAEVKRSVLSVDHIISISAFTKSELIDAYNIPSEKITVIHEAINRENFSVKKIESFELPQYIKFLEDSRFLLSVGHIEPRKNYERLIEAFNILKQESKNSDLKLVIVGKKNHNYKKVVKLFNCNSDIVYLDFVSRELLLWLYKNSCLFVFPSLYEGFGFPPLEAACLDTISAVSEVSSIPEICRDSVVYFNPYDVSDISQKISSCLYDDKLISEKHLLLHKNIDRFSWTKNAEETIKIMQNIISQDKSQ